MATSRTDALALDRPPDVYRDDEAVIAWDDETGEIDVSEPEAEREKSDPEDHGANLAEHLEEGKLAEIADFLVECFESDAEARKPWEQRLARGMEIVGYVPLPEGQEAFPGASTVTYPIISEAIIQFNARAMDELFPASGPVKAVVVGDKTRERQEQAERVQEYMNYQITEEDPGWHDEDDRLTMRLPLDGMGWKKVYRDERLGIQTSRYVSAHDVFAPYSATALHSIPRLCHRYYVRPNDLLFEQRSGAWLDVEIPEPPGVDEKDRGEVQEAIDTAEGSDPGSSATRDADKVHEILEFYVDYDLPGFEHVDDEDGKPTGFALPYVIILEKDARQILRITRNWKEGDDRFRKRINLKPFRFLPGMGFYGFGLLHAVGSLNEAATGALRALLDAAHRKNAPGGLMPKDLNIKGGSIAYGFGEYVPVDATYEELQKAFFTPPFGEPSEALFKLLGMLVEAGKSYTGATEAMTGSAPSTGPVGTMVALIEQGNKVFSGIHKRLHKAKRDEYRLLAELNGEHVPEEGYPYDPGNEERTVYAEDFGPEVDVLPVSDPNIFSAHQRIAMSQAVLELSTAHPDLYDRREAHRRMLEALKTPDIDTVLLDLGQKPRLDPVSENMRLLNGQPANAFPDQAHEAHIVVHQQFMMHPGFGGNPEVQEVVGPPMTAHLAQHLAYLYQQRMMQAAGIPYVPADIDGQGAGDGAEEDEQQVPPEVQEQIAVQAAMAGEQFLQTKGLPQPPDPQAEQEARQAEMEAVQQAQEMERKQAEWQAEQERKMAAFMEEQARKQREWEAEQARKAGEHEAEQRREEEEHDAEMERRREEAKARQKERESAGDSSDESS